MKLILIDIRNFRSIREERIRIAPDCLVLVGINESGKSNILRALALLNSKEAINKDDVRLNKDGEDPVGESFIRFVFELEDAEIDGLREKFLEKVLVTDIDRAFAKSKAGKLSLKEFCKHFNQVNWRVDIAEQKRYSTHWKVDGFELSDHLLEAVESPAAGLQFEYRSKMRNFRDFVAAHVSLTPEQKALARPASFEKVHSAWGELIKGHLEATMPETISWSYDEKFLLPSMINMTAFAAAPGSCVPLKNMFELAGYADIPKVITATRPIQHGVKNLLRRVSVRANEYLHAVWKEGKDVRIELTPNGDNIDIAVADRYNSYAPSKRSDGFKRVLAFLFMIASRVKSGKLTNALILMDEPEMGLHPSGAKFLRDELIELSLKNVVVYSTHSIFMVDRDRLDRHLVVSKENEETSTKVVSEGTVIDEEVIYNALGYSIFESLKAVNLVFEGWRDKRLFEVALANLPKKHKALGRVLAGVGLCHVKGVKEVKTLAALLELANRSCIVLSDDDFVAREHKREHLKNHRYGDWYTYSDVLPSAGIITGEDFIEPEAFEKIISKMRELNAALPPFSVRDLLQPGGKIAALRKWLGKDSDVNIDFIKENVFEHLSADHITDKYFDYLTAVSKLVPKNQSKQKSAK